MPKQEKEEIDLNDEEEEALEKAWENLTKQAQNTDFYTVTTNDLLGNEEGWVTLDNGQHVYVSEGGGIQPSGPNSKAVGKGDKESKGSKGEKEKEPKNEKIAVPKKEGEDKSPYKEGSKGQKLADKAKETHGEWAENLSEAEAKALAKYSSDDSDGYQDINKALRKGREPIRGQEIIDDLDSAISSAPPFAEPTTLYRGVGPQVSRQLQVGSEFTDSGYTSTSSNESVASQFAGDAMIRVTAPAGTRAASMDAFSNSTFNENEYVLPRGTRYRVTGRSRHPDYGTVIDVEILP